MFSDVGLDKYCGSCGGSLDFEEPLVRCCGQVVKTDFCTICGAESANRILTTASLDDGVVVELIDDVSTFIDMVSTQSQ